MREIPALLGAGIIERAPILFQKNAVSPIPILQAELAAIGGQHRIVLNKRLLRNPDGGSHPGNIRIGEQHMPGPPAARAAPPTFK